MANQSRESNGELTVKVNVDVSDALTGLKALRREADAAVRALKAVENVGLRHVREETEIRPEVSE